MQRENRATAEQFYRKAVLQNTTKLSFLSLKYLQQVSLKVSDKKDFQ